MNVIKEKFYALGFEMMSCEPHPARRIGESNYIGYRRDWGPNSHILPGRRFNEPNHQAWKSRVARATRSHQPSESVIDSLFADYIDEASAAVMRSVENSADVLQSVIEMIALLESMRLMQAGGVWKARANKRGDRLRDISVASPVEDHMAHHRNCLPSESMVQLHNMCAGVQRPRADHAKVTRQYATFLEPEHEILPPKPVVTRYEH